MTGATAVRRAALLSAVAAGAWPVIALDARHDLHEQLLAAHPGGVERAIETVGSATVLEEAFRATRRGVVTTSVGLPRPDARVAIGCMAAITGPRPTEA